MILYGDNGDAGFDTGQQAIGFKIDVFVMIGVMVVGESL